MRRLLFVVFAVLVACEQPQPAAPAPQRPSDEPVSDAAERAALTNIAHGATIVSRTGEAFLGTAADNIIDGDPVSYWLNPPHDFPQSIVIALPARARIDRVGLRTINRAYTANHLRFERSLDGAAWQPLAAVTAAASSDAQWFPVAPAEAAFLRVTVVDGRPGDVRLHSVLAQGPELEPPHAGAIEGCWSINGMPALFTRRGDRIVGTVAPGNQAIDLDGGGDGRIYRFVWTRGNDYGLALMTVSPDGKHLTAQEWHEEAIPIFRGNSWFGERCERPVTLPVRDDVPLALLRRVGRYSAFTGDTAALAKLVAALRAPARIVVHEFREATPQANLQRAQRELDRVRAALGSSAAKVTFIAAGSDAPRQEPVTEAMRALYSCVDLEIRR